MTAPTFDDVVGGLSSTGIQALKATLAESWDALSEQEKGDATHLMATLVRARLYEVMGRDVSDFLRILNAAFLNWKVVGKQVVADGVKSVATEMFGFAGAFAGSAIAAAIKGAM